MNDPSVILAVASTGLAGTAIASAAILKGWNGWLEIKRLELTGARGESPTLSSGSRIEIADLRERIRKLEAIANGIEL